MNPPTDWGSLGAMLFVLTTAFTVISLLITKLIVMPAITDSTSKWNDEMKKWTEAADRRYVHAALFEERRDSIDYLVSSHIAQDEKRMDSIDKRLDHIIELFTRK